MSNATLWWLLAGGAVALELVSGTFYLLMLALGMAAAALAAHAGAGLAWQLTCAALVGGGAVLAWSRLVRQRERGSDSSANPDLNLDIGQTVMVEQWQADGHAEVWHRGARWQAELQQPAAQAASGYYRIVAVRGSRLIVAAPPEREN
jgi:membrane protein implicated in regulation of membrane protease activity